MNKANYFLDLPVYNKKTHDVLFFKLLEQKPASSTNCNQQQIEK